MANGFVWNPSRVCFAVLNVLPFPCSSGPILEPALATATSINVCQHNLLDMFCSGGQKPQTKLPVWVKRNGRAMERKTQWSGCTKTWYRSPFFCVPLWCECDGARGLRSLKTVDVLFEEAAGPLGGRVHSEAVGVCRCAVWVVALAPSAS